MGLKITKKEIISFLLVALLGFFLMQCGNLKDSQETIQEEEEQEATGSANGSEAPEDENDVDQDGYTVLEGDSNDSNNTIYPEAPELEDGLDNNLDGVVDEGTNLFDDDGDDYSENDGDTNDADNTIYPSAPELEDGVDNDGDGVVDEGTNLFDDDGDGYSEDDGDTNDANNTIYPDATEIEDGLDNDGDGEVDEEITEEETSEEEGEETVSFGVPKSGGVDTGDGGETGSPGSKESSGMGAPTSEATDLGNDYDDDGDSYTEDGGDCNDADVDINPDASESFGDGVDNDCDGSTDELLQADPSMRDNMMEKMGESMKTKEEEKKIFDFPVETAPMITEMVNEAKPIKVKEPELEKTEITFLLIDNDGDGYSEKEEDCNDADATVYPGNGC